MNSCSRFSWKSFNELSDVGWRSTDVDDQRILDVGLKKDKIYLLDILILDFSILDISILDISIQFLVFVQKQNKF